MAKLLWDQTGERVYETGVDHGVLYLRDNTGAYPTAVAWNGLVSVTEAPSGAEASPFYADNIKYINLRSAEEFGATIEAYTYPDEFMTCDGSAIPTPGLVLGQQGRDTLVCRTARRLATTSLVRTRVTRSTWFTVLPRRRRRRLTRL